MHEVLVTRLGGLSLPRKSVVRLTDRPDMTFTVMFTVDVKQQHNIITLHLENFLRWFLPQACTCAITIYGVNIDSIGRWTLEQ